MECCEMSLADYSEVSLTECSTHTKCSGVPLKEQSVTDGMQWSVCDRQSFSPHRANVVIEICIQVSYIARVKPQLQSVLTRNQTRRPGCAGPIWKAKEEILFLPFRLDAKLQICQFSPVLLLIGKPGRLYICEVVWLVICHAVNRSYVTLAFEDAF